MILTKDLRPPSPGIHSASPSPTTEASLCPRLFSVSLSPPWCPPKKEHYPTFLACQPKKYLSGCPLQPRFEGTEIMVLGLTKVLLCYIIVFPLIESSFHSCSPHIQFSDHCPSEEMFPGSEICLWYPALLFPFFRLSKHIRDLRAAFFSDRTVPSNSWILRDQSSH